MEVALDDEALAPVALDCQSRTTGGTPASVRLWERRAPKRWGVVEDDGGSRVEGNGGAFSTDHWGVWTPPWSLATDLLRSVVPRQPSTNLTACH